MKITRITVMGGMVAALPARAQEAGFPTRPVRVIVAYPAGGIVDLVARIVAEPLSAAWRQPVVVETRTGANGDIASGVVRDAAADGYSVLVGGPYMLANRYLHPSRALGEPFADWAFAARLVESPSLLVVPRASPDRKLEDLVRRAAASPRPMIYGHGGLGTTQHLVTEIWAKGAGLNMVAVPYRGSPPIVPDLLQGTVAMAVLPLSVAAPYVQSGELRALAIAAEQRSPLFPEVQTLAELGHAPANLTSWLGFVVRKSTPVAAQRVITDAAMATIARPDVAARFAPLGAMFAPLAAGDFEAFLRREDARLRDAIQRYGLQAG